jgi:hypothetical protein
MTNETNLTEKFPFLTGIKYNDTEYVGIVQNTDNQIISFYDIDCCKNEYEKKSMLECGDLWWWESNRMLPIDVFLFQEMQDFRHCVRTFILKETEILFGPVTSMQNILKKRIKRRSIQLVKKTT